MTAYDSKYPSGINDKVFSFNLQDYKKMPETYDILMLNHLSEEVTTTKEYQGRELYELIQNANDAGAEKVTICLRGNTLTIANDGNNPFTTDGYGSIMRAHQSPKSDEKYIGYKGLGFRSVLNWTSSIVVRSLAYPGATDGYECRFSQEIAAKNYLKVREAWGAIGEDIEEKLRIATEKFGRSVPLSILAIPEVSSWIAPENVTTEIVLEINADTLSTVVDSLLALTDSQFLIFLNSLRHIKIEIDGIATEMSLIRHDENTCDITCTDQSGNTVVRKWAVEKIDEDKISVGAARQLNACADGVSQHDYMFHAFFPTKIRTGFGCLLHATVELDNSRNHILTTPQRVFDLLEEVVLRLVERIKSLNTQTPTWDAFDILYNPIDPRLIDENLQSFADRLSKSRFTLAVAPTVTGAYLVTDEGIAVSEDFSELVASFCNESFELSPTLLKGFTAVGIAPRINQMVVTALNTFAKRDLDTDRRAHLIAVMARTSHLMWQPHALTLFTDVNGRLINATAFLMTGRKATLPSILNVSIVDYRLEESLLMLLKEDYERFDPSEKIPERQLAGYLRQIADVSYTDFSALKNYLISDSEKPRTESEEMQLMDYLFSQYHIGDRSFMPKDRMLHLLDSKGRPRQACNLIIGRTTGDWAALIDWPTYLADKFPEETDKIQTFLTEGIGMASHVPMLLTDWGKNDEYLEEAVGNETSCYKREEVKRHKDTNARMSFIVDKLFIEKTSVNLLIDAIILDRRAYDAIIPTDGHFCLYYFYYTICTTVVKYSPAAFSVSKQLRALSSYLTKTNEWIGPKIFDTANLKSVDLRRRFDELARLFGAKETIDELSTDEIYVLIAKADGANHKEQYQYYKDLLRGRIEKGETVTPPADLKVWCRIGNKLQLSSASECFYCNDRAPKAIADTLPIFDIGSREGEDLVSRIFGVRRFSDISITVDREATDILNDMTEQANRLVTTRRRAIMLARCFGHNSIAAIRSQWHELSRLSLKIADKVTYCAETHQPGLIRQLEHNEFILDENGDFWLSLENCNLKKDRNSIECIALILCNLFKIEGKKWVNRFYFILRSDVEDLDFRLSNDYSDKYIKLIDSVIANDDLPSDSEAKAGVEFENMSEVVTRIEYLKINLWHRECMENKELQSQYFSRLEHIRHQVREDCEELFNSLPTADMTFDEITRKLMESFINEEDASLTDSVPGVCSCYDAWINKTFGSTFEIQQFPEIHSLTFFPGNEKRIEKLWSEINCEPHGHDDSQPETNTPDYEITVLEDGMFVKLDESDGRRSKINLKSNRRKRRNSTLNEGGKPEVEAEKIVKEYLERKGFAVIPRSSALDPNSLDNYHYDMEYYDASAMTMRYVEVKSSSDGVIHFSEDEYGFAKRHANTYDLYVIVGGEMFEFPRAFRQMELKAIPEAYKLRITRKPDIIDSQDKYL